MNPMAWLGGTESCSLSRPPVLSEELEARGAEVHVAAPYCDDGPARVDVWRLPKGILSRSLVVRKLAAWDPEKRLFVIRPTCQETRRSVAIAMDWPRCPADFLPWATACDFLMVSPDLHELAFAVSCAMHSWLASAEVALSNCSSLEALAHSRRIQSYGALAKLAPIVGAGQDEEMYPYGRSPSRRTEEASALSLASGGSSQFLESIRRNDMADAGLPVVDALHALALVCVPYAAMGGVTEEYCAFRGHPSPLCGAVESVAQTLLGLTNTARGSLHLLGNVRDLCAAFGSVAARHYVHRCFCCLYLAETFEEVDLCAVPLETAYDLQGFYREGVLNLSCFVPARDRLSFLLPGLLGARETAHLFPSAGAIFERASLDVPWLRAAMTGPYQLHLTGSFLCWCRTGEEPAVNLPPGDVDLFCERIDDLGGAGAWVSECMLASARHLWSDAVVVVSKPNAYRLVLKVQLPSEAQRLDGVPAYALNCDVYVNNTKNVSQYHLPQVRGSLSMESGRPRLFLTASAAIAWITMLNIDYNAFRGAKTPFEIIARRWLWGFNLCVSDEESRLMSRYLLSAHPHEYIAKDDMRRPRRLVAHVGCVLMRASPGDVLR